MKRARFMAVLMTAALVVPAVASASARVHNPAAPHTAAIAAAAACHGCPPPVPLPVGAWHPVLAARWQIQLQGVVGHCATGGFVTDVSGPPFGGGASVAPDVYAIDLYVDHGRCPSIPAGTVNRAAVTALHAAGRHAVAYVDAGSWERWRPDAGAFVRYDHRCGGCLLGATLGGFPDERYLNISNPRTRTFLLARMRTRMLRARRAGFDGVYFDNQDEYHWAPTGFHITRHDQLVYLTHLIDVAHRLGLAAGPNNDIEQTAAFTPYADLMINESCHRWHECGWMWPMLRAGKPVFQIEYRRPMAAYCPSALRQNFSTIFKQPALFARPWVACG
jgi:hypothetical protein